MQFDWFVIPFVVGLVFLIGQLGRIYVPWFIKLSREEKEMIRRHWWSRRTLGAVKEIIQECLLHRRIFRINPPLGFMHLSFALGWFLLIITGKLEALFYTHDALNPLWYPLFFKYFEPGRHAFFGESVFIQLMDFWLLVILGGQSIAVVKRLWPGKVGAKKKVQHAVYNRVALMSLWAIFPLRLLAESVTVSYYGGGGFLTGTLGTLLAEVPGIERSQPVLWWAYSIALGCFFVAMPFSRYMHIPTEVLLILFRRWGIKNNLVAHTMSEVELLSCSACGMCLEVCPLNEQELVASQPVYFLERLRMGWTKPSDLWKCLNCGRCEAVCPVLVKANTIRLKEKQKVLPAITPAEGERVKIPAIGQGRLLLYSGCMGKLVPSVRQAMDVVLRHAGLDYQWLDDRGNICCGRPLLLSGQVDRGMAVLKQLENTIREIGPDILVTTCPICYNMINKYAALPFTEVLHHTEFLAGLIHDNRLKVEAHKEKLVFHDPCELGRQSGIYEQPREILRCIGRLVEPQDNKAMSRCCGGALSGLMVDMSEKVALSEATRNSLLSSGAQKIITACPLCRKTLGRQANVPVLDVAEELIRHLSLSNQETAKEKSPPERAFIS
ncbi:(Fe-S)-binding protein [Marinilabiliaceae bacterium JC017]|nr:(Fe-S)-binding protein [Marinilabiliaceae bacterium JC017]